MKIYGISSPAGHYPPPGGKWRRLAVGVHSAKTTIKREPDMEHRIQRVGILDVNGDIGEDLPHWLLQRGYLADIMQDAKAMMDYCQQLNPAAVIVDVCQGMTDGPNLIGRLRKAGYTAPIIATCAGRDDALQIETLHMGADDFLQKPMDMRQLLQRLDLVLRQSAGKEHDEDRSASERLEEVLTATEKRIFQVLKDHAPAPLSRDQIMWEVKRQRMTPEDRSIDVYISNILLK